MNNIVGPVFLMLFPFAMVAIRLTTGVEYPWYFSEYANVFDLVAATLLIVMAMVGVQLVFCRVRLYLNFSIFLLFVMFQTAIWSFDTDKPLAIVYLDSENAHFLLISVDHGAFTPSSLANLVLLRNQFNLFYSADSLRSFANVKAGALDYDEQTGMLAVYLDFYSGASDRLLLHINEFSP